MNDLYLNSYIEKILLDSNAAKECPIHLGSYYKATDKIPQKAFIEGAKLVNEKYIDLDHATFRSHMVEYFNNILPEECMECEKLNRE
jgi:hypothetical protein